MSSKMLKTEYPYINIINKGTLYPDKEGKYIYITYRK
jgi:hypothetical protein